jgi:drug/metabolite transporter (DMT)-like permease
LFLPLASGGGLRCDGRSLLSFLGGGIAENTGVFLVLVALGLGEVSVVTPLAGMAPLFVLLPTGIFLRGMMNLSWRIMAGAILIVLGVLLLKAGSLAPLSAGGSRGLPLFRSYGLRPVREGEPCMAGSS